MVLQIVFYELVLRGFIPLCTEKCLCFLTCCFMLLLSKVDFSFSVEDGFTSSTTWSEISEHDVSILSQFALPNLNFVLGLQNVYCGFISASVTTIAWSEIPGAYAIDLINDGFVLNTKSSKFSSLVGSLCIC